MLMECVQAVEHENGIRLCEHCWKPTLPQQLHSLVGHVVTGTLAVVDIHGMNSRSVKNHECRRPWHWAWAYASSMSKLHVNPKVFETVLVEELTGPLLIIGIFN
jgi:adenosyl cobinamide kinase/adenosyl cobinamide phosphate guanylyltransferase